MPGLLDLREERQGAWTPSLREEALGAWTPGLREKGLYLEHAGSHRDNLGEVCNMAELLLHVAQE